MIWLSMLILIIFSMNLAIAQDNSDEERVTVRKSILTSDQLAKLKAEQTAQETVQKIETVGKYAGLGKEVGTAVSQSLNAITDSAAKFANTSVGRFTMFLVAYKVIGREFLQLVFGLFFLIVWLPIMIWSYKRTCLPYRVLVGVTKEGEKKWDVLNKPEDIDDYDGQVRRWAHAIIFIILLLITIGIVFG